MPIAELRAVVGRLGFEGVETYVQSGNVVFDAGDDRSEGELVRGLETAIETEFGFDVPVIVRSATDMAATAAGHPLDDGGTDPKLLLVGFLDAEPAVEVDDVMDPGDFAPDRWELAGRELFLSYPNGSGRSKLTHSLIERRLGVRCTTRNWCTVNKLAAMAAR